MAKYDPLRDFLRRRREDALDLSFREIEAKLGYMLPNASSRAHWWNSEAEPGVREVQKIAWRDAGYDAALLPNERVRFRRRAGTDGAALEDQEPKSKAI